MRFKKWPSLESLQRSNASESSETACEAPWVSLLDCARRNGHARYVEGLDSFFARVTPVEPTPVSALAPGYLLEIQTTGRELDADEKRELIAFADGYLSERQ